MDGCSNLDMQFVPFALQWNGVSNVLATVSYQCTQSNHLWQQPTAEIGASMCTFISLCNLCPPLPQVGSTWWLLCKLLCSLSMMWC